jgi:hypothetical protein
MLEELSDTRFGGIDGIGYAELTPGHPQAPRLQGAAQRCEPGYRSAIAADHHIPESGRAGSGTCGSKSSLLKKAWRWEKNQSRFTTQVLWSSIRPQ